MQLSSGKLFLEDVSKVLGVRERTAGYYRRGLTGNNQNICLFEFCLEKVK